MTYRNRQEGVVSDAYAEGACTICGQSRITCSIEAGDPFVKENEE